MVDGEGLIKPVKRWDKDIGRYIKPVFLEIGAHGYGLKKEFNDHLEDYDKEKINEIRKEINDFSLSCQRGEHHTRDEFERIFSRIGEYHVILKKLKQENGKIDIEVEYINKIYQSCLEEHRFFEG